jgi:MarR-like DNA-binding transcriptional regulator SgrR of sgrS sRNA
MAAPKHISDRQVKWLRRVYRPGHPVQGNIAALARVVGCTRQHAKDIIDRKRRADIVDPEND